MLDIKDGLNEARGLREEGFKKFRQIESHGCILPT
jgi:hypothetical protein